MWAWVRWVLAVLLQPGGVPQHVAFIMDGNRRYAAGHSIQKIHGHSRGYSKMVETIHWCLELGVPVISVYAFSIDNFARSMDEVESLMGLAERKFHDLMQNDGLAERKGVEVRIVGDMSLAPPAVQAAAARLMNKTAGLAAKHAVLNICFAYSSCEELVHATDVLTTGLASGALLPQDITPQMLHRCLRTEACPGVDVVIRTSGETRLSDFLTWQACHASLAWETALWPDWTYARFAQCIVRWQLARGQQAALRTAAHTRLAHTLGCDDGAGAVPHVPRVLHATRSASTVTPTTGSPAHGRVMATEDAHTAVRGAPDSRRCDPPRTNHPGGGAQGCCAAAAPGPGLQCSQAWACDWAQVRAGPSWSTVASALQRRWAQVYECTRVTQPTSPRGVQSRTPRAGESAGREESGYRPQAGSTRVCASVLWAAPTAWQAPRGALGYLAAGFLRHLQQPASCVCSAVCSALGGWATPRGNVAEVVQKLRSAGECPLAPAEPGRAHVPTPLLTCRGHPWSRDVLTWQGGDAPLRCTSPCERGDVGVCGRHPSSTPLATRCSECAGTTGPASPPTDTPRTACPEPLCSCGGGVQLECEVAGSLGVSSVTPSSLATSSDSDSPLVSDSAGEESVSSLGSSGLEEEEEVWGGDGYGGGTPHGLGPVNATEGDRAVVDDTPGYEQQQGSNVGRRHVGTGDLNGGVPDASRHQADRAAVPCNTSDSPLVTTDAQLAPALGSSPVCGGPDELVGHDAGGCGRAAPWCTPGSPTHITTTTPAALAGGAGCALCGGGGCARVAALLARQHASHTAWVQAHAGRTPEHCSRVAN